MFVSVRWLINTHNIDPEIAKFFVDRQPPKGNFLWKDKLLYLRPTDGYLFIPCIIDLLYRLGISKEQLLSPFHIDVFEKVLDISVREEKKLITMTEAIKLCREVIADKAVNLKFLDEVTKFLVDKQPSLFDEVSVPYLALHRGDVLLFSFAALQFPSALIVPVAQAWFTLIVNYLIIDDVVDYTPDLTTGSENAFIEAGLTPKTVTDIYNLYHLNLRHLHSLNPGIAGALRNIFTSRLPAPDIAPAFRQVPLPWL